MAEIITRKYVNGEVVNEHKKEVDWKPNAADLDTVIIKCECGNEFDLPRDCLMFGFKNMLCGGCGKDDGYEIKERH